VTITKNAVVEDQDEQAQEQTQKVTGSSTEIEAIGAVSAQAEIQLLDNEAQDSPSLTGAIEHSDPPRLADLLEGAREDLAPGGRLVRQQQDSSASNETIADTTGNDATRQHSQGLVECSLKTRPSDGYVLCDAAKSDVCHVDPERPPPVEAYESATSNDTMTVVIALKRNEPTQASAAERLAKTETTMEKDVEKPIAQANLSLNAVPVRSNRDPSSPVEASTDNSALKAQVEQTRPVRTQDESHRINGTKEQDEGFHLVKGSRAEYLERMETKNGKAIDDAEKAAKSKNSKRHNVSSSTSTIGTQKAPSPNQKESSMPVVNRTSDPQVPRLPVLLHKACLSIRWL
jgi:hypothetical protein